MSIELNHDQHFLLNRCSNIGRAHDMYKRALRVSDMRERLESVSIINYALFINAPRERMAKYAYFKKWCDLYYSDCEPKMRRLHALDMCATLTIYDKKGSLARCNPLRFHYEPKNEYCERAIFAGEILKMRF